MDIVFKLVEEPSNEVELVGHTDFKKHYSGVNTSMAWDELTPAIRQATEKFVLPYVGEEWYNDLATKYNAGSNLSTEQKRALELLQDCVAFYSIYHVLPEKNAVVASLGVMQNDPSAGAIPVNQWGWKAKRWSALENGDSFLDTLLNYMELQVKASKPEFDIWKTSAAYKVKTSDYFRHTVELDEYLNIQMSRRSFISLVRFMKQVETDVIAPILCTDLYAATITDPVSDANKKLLPFIKKAVAYLGAAEAVPHHRIVIDGDGFRVVSKTDQFDDRRNMTNNTHESAIQALMLRCHNQGSNAVTQLKKFLEDNIDDYPDYKDSDCRDLPASKGHSIVQSDDGIGAVGIF